MPKVSKKPSKPRLRKPSPRRAAASDGPVERFHRIRREISEEKKRLGLTEAEYRARRMAVLRKKGFPV